MRAPKCTRRGASTPLAQPAPPRARSHSHTRVHSDGEHAPARSRLGSQSIANLRLSLSTISHSAQKMDRAPPAAGRSKGPPPPRVGGGRTAAASPPLALQHRGINGKSMRSVTTVLALTFSRAKAPSWGVKKAPASGCRLLREGNCGEVCSWKFGGLVQSQAKVRVPRHPCGFGPQIRAELGVTAPTSCCPALPKASRTQIVPQTAQRSSPEAVPTVPEDAR